MDGVIERRKHEHNHRMRQAYMTAQFSRVKEMPPLSDFLIDVDKPTKVREQAKTPQAQAKECDHNMMQWALLLGTDEQRRLLCR